VRGSSWKPSSPASRRPRSSLQQALQLQPSPQLGHLLDHLMLEQAFGRLSGHEACLEAARAWLDSQASGSDTASLCD
jgi:tRNA nucleotidyltransferase (CCA-adding enzyme)